MKAADVMTPSVISIAPDAPVMQAVRIPIEGLLSAAGLAMVDGAIVDDPNATQVSSSLAKAYPYQTMRW